MLIAGALPLSAVAGCAEATGTRRTWHRVKPTDRTGRDRIMRVRGEVR